MTIKEALINAQKQFKKNKISSAGIDAEILLLEAMGKKQKTKNKKQKIEIDKTWLYARPEYELNKNRQKKFEGFVKRRLEGKPIAYIISRKEFFGLDFYVDKRVMIPRPETEIIVEKIIQDAKQDKHFFAVELALLKQSSLQKCLSCSASAFLQIIDVGTGSGCIAIALAKNLQLAKASNASECESIRCLHKRRVKFYAIDISKEAIEVAKINAKKNKVFSRIKFLKGNLLDPVQKLKIKNYPTIIIANLPYLKTKDIKKNIGLTYEPIGALDGGEDGLEKIKELIIQIKKIDFNIFECWLEINSEQTESLIFFIKENLDRVDIKIIKDLSGQNRFLKINKN
jgi:release factor glutamine methyltransferase